MDEFHTDVFLRLANAMPHLVWIARPDGEVSFYNDRVADFRGAQRGPGGMWQWEGILHPDDIGPTLEAWSAALAAGTPYEMQHRVCMKDGSYRWHISRGLPQKDAQGAITDWFGTATDIHELVSATERAETGETLLQESERRFRALADDAPAFMFLSGPGASSDYFNATWLRFAGRDAADAAGLGWTDVSHPDDLPGITAIYNEAFSARQPFTIRVRMRRAEDGSWRWILWKGTPRSAADGTFLGFMGIGVDMTEQVEAEEALSYQKTVLETVTKNTDMALFLMDDRQYCVYMNEGAEQLTGFSLEELKGKQLHYHIHHMHPDGSPFPLEECPIDQALPTHKRMKGEEVFVHKDGSFYPVSFTASPIVVDGKAVGTVIEVRGTAEEKKQKQTLQESEALFRHFSDNITNLAWIADGEGWIFWYNERWYDYTGTTLEEMQGWGWEKVHHPDHIERVVDFVKGAWSRNEPFELTFPLRGRNGSYKWFLTRAVPILNEEGRIIRWIGTNTDIDREKKLADNLEELVAERTRALEAANKALLESNSDLQRFAHVASHDLKEPVRKIKVFSTMLSADAGSLPEAGRIRLEKIQKSTERVTAMIDGILSYATFNEQNDIHETIDLNRVIEEVITDLELTIQERGAVVRHDRLPAIEGAPVLIHQLFYNLINNALKFARPGVAPDIQISAAYRERTAEIRIADNGIGFEPQFSRQIFDSFTRLNPKDQYEGTGLGLSLCKRIVERHSGTIRAESVPGAGATFIIEFPGTGDRG